MKIFLKHLWEQISSHNRLIVNLVIVATLYHSFVVGKLQHKIEMMQVQLSEVGKSVTDYEHLLQPLINDFGASRVAVYKFVIDKKPSIYDLASARIELIKFVFRREQDTPARIVQVLPLSLYVDIMPRLINHVPIVYYVKDMPEGALKELMTGRNTVFVIWIDISDENNNIIGTIRADWSELENVPKGNDVDHLIMNAKSIAANVGKRINKFQ